jgi:hypothetical protein
MEFCFIVLAGIALVVYLIWRNNRTKLENMDRAKQAYYDSLEQLKQDPTNPNLRQQTLQLGREYADREQDSTGETVFDEAHLKNDLDAVCAGAGGVGVVRASASAEIRKLTELLEEHILTPEEWQSAKAQLVGLKENQVDEAVKLLRALHQLVILGGLTEGEYNQKKWDILSQKLISPDRPPIVPPKMSDKT